MPSCRGSANVRKLSGAANRNPARWVDPHRATSPPRTRSPAPPRTLDTPPDGVRCRGVLAGARAQRVGAEHLGRSATVHVTRYVARTRTDVTRPSQRRDWNRAICIRYRREHLPCHHLSRSPRGVPLFTERIEVGMHVDDRALNGLIEESQDLQSDAMHQNGGIVVHLRDIAEDERGKERDPDIVAAFNDSRRELLGGFGRGAGRIGGRGLLAGGIGAALAALLAAPASADKALDIQILQTASSLEVLAVATYGAALTLPFIKDGNPRRREVRPDDDEAARRAPQALSRRRPRRSAAPSRPMPTRSTSPSSSRPRPASRRRPTS